MNEGRSTTNTFEDVWSLGDPVMIENKFREMIAEGAVDCKSTYMQILTQIALALALQKKFIEAHQTLDIAERQLDADHEIASVRILLERGRVFHQAGQLDDARHFFQRASERGAAYGCDFLAIDAAHMMAIIGQDVDEKIRWNQLAIDRTQKTQDDRARKWMGSLYNNLGQFLYESEKYKESHLAYTQALAHREQEAYEPNIRVAKWAVARSLRHLQREDEALPILQDLVDEYASIVESGNPGLPAEMLTLVRGMVFKSWQRFI